MIRRIDKSFVRTAALLIAGACLFAGCKPRTPPGKSGTEAAKPAVDFENTVLKSTRPVLVDFGATWCGPCKQMEPILDRIEKDFAVTRIDVDHDQDLAIRYQISAIPALLIFVDGQVAKKYVGLTSEAELRAELTRLSAK